jgi:hypothetical protein
MAEGLAEPPYIVPMSRQADERLWVEVLNRGATTWSLFRQTSRPLWFVK